MISIIDFQVKAYDLDHLDLSWGVLETAEDLDRYSFYVMRSVDGAGGPYLPIAGPMDCTYRFRDPEVNQLHKWRTYFYKLRIIHKETAQELEVGPCWLSAKPDLLVLEIQRREMMLFHKFIGRKVLLYPAITSGQRCGNCFDRGPRGNTTSRSRQSNCPTCFDTTFVHGYAAPLLVYAQIDPSPRAVQRMDIAERAQVVSSGRLSAFPPVKPKDLLVESENKRWLIEKVTVTEKARAVVRQELELHGYAPSDIVYKIPVDMSILDNASPMEEFSRKMTLEYTPPTVEGLKV